MGLEERLAQLEGRAPRGGQGPGDTSSRALVIGGWPPEQEGATTLEKAKQVLAELQASPKRSPQEGETNDAQRVRIQRAIQRVRNSNATLYQGTRTHPRDSGWLLARISQPPDSGSKDQEGDPGADKGALDRIEVEFSTGSVWLDQVRVSGTSGPRPSQAVDAGPGWIYLPKIAELLKTDEVLR